jgi:hypothetical protein
MRKIFLIPMLMIMTVLMTTSAFAMGSSRDAEVRVIHASPDAPNVDVLVDGAVAFENAPFRGITEYASLSPGTYNVQVVPSGATAPVVIDEDLTLQPRQDYTVLAVDTLDSIMPLVLRDRNTWVPKYGSRLRFVHASP